MKFNETQGYNGVVSSPVRCHWLPIYERNSINVPCDTVKARPAARAAVLCRMVLIIYDKFHNAAERTNMVECRSVRELSQHACLLGTTARQRGTGSKRGKQPGHGR